MRVVSLVDRDTGSARSIPANAMKAGEVSAIVRNNVARDAKLTTDESRFYWRVGKDFAGHDRVLHAGLEYLRGDIHPHAVEACFSNLKVEKPGACTHHRAQHYQRSRWEFYFRTEEPRVG